MAERVPDPTPNLPGRRRRIRLSTASTPSTWTHASELSIPGGTATDVGNEQEMVGLANDPNSFEVPVPGTSSVTPHNTRMQRQHEREESGEFDRVVQENADREAARLNQLYQQQQREDKAMYRPIHSEAYGMPVILQEDRGRGQILPVDQENPLTPEQAKQEADKLNHEEQSKALKYPRPTRVVTGVDSDVNQEGPGVMQFGLYDTGEATPEFGEPGHVVALSTSRQNIDRTHRRPSRLLGGFSTLTGEEASAVAQQLEDWDTHRFDEGEWVGHEPKKAIGLPDGYSIEREYGVGQSTYHVVDPTGQRVSSHWSDTAARQSMNPNYRAPVPRYDNTKLSGKPEEWPYGDLDEIDTKAIHQPTLDAALDTVRQHLENPAPSQERSESWAAVQHNNPRWTHPSNSDAREAGYRVIGDAYHSGGMSDQDFNDTNEEFYQIAYKPGDKNMTSDQEWFALTGEDPTPLVPTRRQSTPTSEVGLDHYKTLENPNQQRYEARRNPRGYVAAQVYDTQSGSTMSLHGSFPSAEAAASRLNSEENQRLYPVQQEAAKAIGRHEIEPLSDDGQTVHLVLLPEEQQGEYVLADVFDRHGDAVNFVRDRDKNPNYGGEGKAYDNHHGQQSIKAMDEHMSDEERDVAGHTAARAIDAHHHHQLFSGVDDPRSADALKEAIWLARKINEADAARRQQSKAIDDGHIELLDYQDEPHHPEGCSCGSPDCPCNPWITPEDRVRQTPKPTDKTKTLDEVHINEVELGNGTRYQVVPHEEGVELTGRVIYHDRYADALDDAVGYRDYHEIPLFDNTRHSYHAGNPNHPGYRPGQQGQQYMKGWVTLHTMVGDQDTAHALDYFRSSQPNETFRAVPDEHRPRHFHVQQQAVTYADESPSRQGYIRGRYGFTAENVPTHIATEHLLTEDPDIGQHGQQSLKAIDDGHIELLDYQDEPLPEEAPPPETNQSRWQVNYPSTRARGLQSEPKRGAIRDSQGGHLMSTDLDDAQRLVDQYNEEERRRRERQNASKALGKEIQFGRRSGGRPGFARTYHDVTPHDQELLDQPHEHQGRETYVQTAPAQDEESGWPAMGPHEQGADWGWSASQDVARFATQQGYDDVRATFPARGTTYVPPQQMSKWREQAGAPEDASWQEVADWYEDQGKPHVSEAIRGHHASGDKALSAIVDTSGGALITPPKFMGTQDKNCPVCGGSVVAFSGGIRCNHPPCERATQTKAYDFYVNQTPGVGYTVTHRRPGHAEHEGYSQSSDPRFYNTEGEAIQAAEVMQQFHQQLGRNSNIYRNQTPGEGQEPHESKAIKGIVRVRNSMSADWPFNVYETLPQPDGTDSTFQVGAHPTYEEALEHAADVAQRYGHQIEDETDRDVEGGSKALLHLGKGVIRIEHKPGLYPPGYDFVHHFTSAAPEGTDRGGYIGGFLTYNHAVNAAMQSRRESGHAIEDHVPVEFSGDSDATTYGGKAYLPNNPRYHVSHAPEVDAVAPYVIYDQGEPWNSSVTEARAQGIADDMNATHYQLLEDEMQGQQSLKTQPVDPLDYTRFQTGHGGQGDPDFDYIVDTATGQVGGNDSSSRQQEGIKDPDYHQWRLGAHSLKAQPKPYEGYDELLNEPIAPEGTHDPEGEYNYPHRNTGPCQAVETPQGWRLTNRQDDYTSADDYDQEFREDQASRWNLPGTQYGGQHVVPQLDAHGNHRPVLVGEIPKAKGYFDDCPRDPDTGFCLPQNQVGSAGSSRTGQDGSGSQNDPTPVQGDPSGSGGIQGSGNGMSELRQAYGGQNPLPDSEQLIPPTPEQEQAEVGWLTYATNLPRQVLSRARQSLANRYAALEARYGKKYAIAILGASLTTIAIPVPGTALLAPVVASPIVAIAELHRALSRRGRQEQEVIAGKAYKTFDDPNRPTWVVEERQGTVAGEPTHRVRNIQTPGHYLAGSVEEANQLAGRLNTAANRATMSVHEARRRQEEAQEGKAINPEVNPQVESSTPDAESGPFHVVPAHETAPGKFSIRHRGSGKFPDSHVVGVGADSHFATHGEASRQADELNRVHAPSYGGPSSHFRPPSEVRRGGINHITRDMANHFAGTAGKLDENDHAAISAYTDNQAHYQLNSNLHSGKPLNERSAALHSQLQSAFSKAGGEFPHPLTLYRGASSRSPERMAAFLNEVHEAHTSGKPLTLNAYQSTSIVPGVAVKSTSDRKREHVVMEIAAKRGLPVDGIVGAKYPEGEVILNAGEKYRVHGIHQNVPFDMSDVGEEPRHKTVIQLEQL